MAGPGYLGIMMCSRALLLCRACAGKDPGRSARPGMSQAFAGPGGDGAGTGIPGARSGHAGRAARRWAGKVAPLPAPSSHPIPAAAAVHIHPSVTARGVGRGGSAESAASDAAPARRDEPRRSHGSWHPGRAPTAAAALLLLLLLLPWALASSGCLGAARGMRLLEPRGGGGAWT